MELSSYCTYMKESGREQGSKTAVQYIDQQHRLLLLFKLLATVSERGARGEGSDSGKNNIRRGDDDGIQ